MLRVSLSIPINDFCLLSVSSINALKLERVNLLMKNSFWRRAACPLAGFISFFFSRFVFRFSLPFSALHELISKFPSSSLAALIFKSKFCADMSVSLFPFSGSVSMKSEKEKVANGKFLNVSNLILL